MLVVPRNSPELGAAPAVQQLAGFDNVIWLQVIMSKMSKPKRADFSKQVACMHSC